MVALGRSTPNTSQVPDTGSCRIIHGWLLSRRLRWLWHHFSVPRYEWVGGSTAVFHGTNYIVPPTSKTATIISVHDVGFEHQPPQCIPEAMHHKQSVRFAIRKGATVHTDSQFVADEVAHYYAIPTEQIVTIAPGIRLYPAGPHPVPGSPYILTLGSSDKRKDLITAIAAFNRIATEFSDLRFIHAGPSGDDDPRLQTAITQSPFQQRISQLGYVNQATKSALLQDAAVVVYPSRYEGFGLVPLEAMLAGTPVVTTRSSSIPEVAGDAALYAEIGDPDSLAERITQVLSCSDLASTLKARGTEQAKNYNWATASHKFLKLYRDATNN